ncbi:hypothetical protein, partial [Treponema sp.]|uniref:hypothetical protein n=1 Tax=Treponema sp. TaxID=166 RepID=UPI003890195B
MQLRFTQFAKILFLIIIFNTPAFLTSQSDTFRPLCTSISAKKTGINKIQITWKCPSDFNASSIAIFRDNKPITLKSTVSAGHPVAEVPGNFTSYTDSLKKYGEYYYALIARDKNGNLYNMLFPTVNTTEKSVKLEAPANLYGETTGSDEQYVPGFLRELPLPYLDLISDLDVKPTKMGNKASNAGYELAGEHSLKKTKLLSPYIFEDDLICAPDGDDFYLFESLKTYFI